MYIGSAPIEVLDKIDYKYLGQIGVKIEKTRDSLDVLVKPVEDNELLKIRV